MAKILLATLLVLMAVRTLPDLIRLRNFSRLRDALLNVGNGREGSPWLLVLLPALIVLGVLLLDAGLHRHGVLQFAFMLVVLFFCWGPRDVDADIDSILKAPDSERRSTAAQVLQADFSAPALPFTAPALVQASFAAALSRQFGVLLWFVLAGPAGAVAYRLSQLLAHAPDQADLSDANRAVLARIATVLDWAPARLMALALALVSDFEAVMRRWREYRGLHAQGWFHLDNGFLGTVAHAGVDADVGEDRDSSVRGHDPLLALVESRRLLRRMLKLWLGVIALIVLGGWAG